MNKLPKPAAAVFNEWLRQWKKDPEAFANLEDMNTSNGPDSYGDRCVATYNRIVSEGVYV
jgi:hypothetical protein